VNLIRTHPINGSNGVTVGKMKDTNTLLVLVGEVHDNAGRCPSPRYDALKHIVLKAIREVPGTFLSIEGFPCSISDDVPTLMRSIREEPYLDDMLRCVRDADFACQYGGANRGNLAILRTLKMVVHAARLCYPGDLGVQEMDDRIQYFDVRRNLGMQSPFMPWVFLNIRKSLAHIDKIRGFLRPIPHAEWARDFHELVLVPMLREASWIYNSPSVSVYTRFFIEVPDVVAVNQILERAARSRVILMYAGDNHRLGVLKLLGRVCHINILAESKDSREDGSCSFPTQKSSAASLLYRRSLLIP
jgi:hypothetical protein